MLKLRTLGGLTLEGLEASAVGGAVLHRKRLALLAVLGASDGVSRDKLLGLLWPESSETRARHALAQSLYALRRALDIDDLVLGNQELRVNRAVLEVDVWSFERLLGAGHLDDAVALYRGPFLDGIYVDDARAFEEWVSTERQRLSQRYAHALESLAALAEQAGAFGEAVKWWRQLALFDPLAAGPALGVMRSLVAGGDAAAALQHASLYRAHVSSELGIQCSHELSALADSVRAQLAPIASQSSADLAPSSSVRIEERTAEQRQASSAPNDGLYSRPDILASGQSEGTRRWRREIGVAVACLLLLATFGAARLARGFKGGVARLDPDRVAVFPFVVGAAGVDYLADGMVNLLAAALDSAATVQIVDPRSLLARVNAAPNTRTDPAAAAAIAKEFGAGGFVLGNVTELNGRVELTASLYNTQSTKEVATRASVSGDRSATFGLIDHLAEELLAARLKAPGQRLDRLAALTTSSLPALKAYLLGEREMRVRHYFLAMERFQDAIACDTSFALAHYRLSMAADWSGQTELADSAAARATRYASRLSAHDRMLVEALAAWRTNDIDEAERQYRTLILHHPDDVEAWYQLGEVYFHNNPARGLSFLDARAPFERALALEPTDPNGPMHLIRIATWQERWSAVDSLLRRLDPKEIDGGLALYRGLARGDTALDRAIKAFSVVDANALFVSTVRLAVYTHRLDAAERLAAALSSDSRPRDERAIGYHLRAYLAATRGRWRSARAYADSTRAFALHYGMETTARLAAAPFAPFMARELARLRHEVLASREVPPTEGPTWGTGRYAPREYPQRMTALAAILSARMGDTSALRADIGAVGVVDTSHFRPWRDWRQDRVALLRAWSSRLAGRPGDAVQLLQTPHPPDEWGSRDEERFFLAEMLRDSGRPEDALRWFSSFEQIGIEDLPWAAPAHLMRARLLDRLGRRREAMQDYARVVELWKDCDAELRPLLEEARRRSNS